MPSILRPILSRPHSTPSRRKLDAVETRLADREIVAIAARLFNDETHHCRSSRSRNTSRTISATVRAKSRTNPLKR